MPWVRGKEVIKAHDRAMTYIQNWWEQNKGRALIANVTGDQYGIDFYNDIEYIHINWRTEKGIWNKGSFPYSSLRELKHKIIKYQKLRENTKKDVYVIHVSTDYSRFIISTVDSFDPINSKLVSMPSETNEKGHVKSWVCFSSEFEEYALPPKNFGNTPIIEREYVSNNNPQTTLRGYFQKMFFMKGRNVSDES